MTAVEARSRSWEGVLAELADELAAEDSILSPCVVRPSATERPLLGGLVAAGRAGSPDASAYAGVVEAAREGYLLHYGEPRLSAGMDPDLRLLAGDYMYAKGLLRLSALDDAAAVEELSDLISLAAQMHAEVERPATGPVWLACVTAISVGGSAEHREAKAALRRGGGADALLAASREAAAKAGLGQPFADAAETVLFASSGNG